MKTMMTIILVSIGLIILALMFSSLGYTRINPESIVGMWLLDEGKGDVAKDYSNDGLDGTIEGRLKWVEGKFGKALEFNGTDVRVVIPSLGKMTKEKASVVLWVNPEFDIGDGKTYGQIGIGGHFGDGLGAKDEKCHQIFKWGGNNWFFRVGFDNPNVGVGANQFTSAQDIMPKDKWAHIAMTWEKGGESVVYINSSRIGILSGKTETLTSWRQENIFIGTSWNNDKHRGLIDEVGLFNHVLSYDDINNIMTNGLEKATGITAVSPTDKLSTTWASIKTH